MSYDLFLFHAPPREDPLAYARAAFDPTDDSPVPPPPSGWRERMRAAAHAVAAADPSLALERHGEGPLEERMELYGPEEGSGLQILVFADAVYLHLPYWHTGADARQAWEQAWTALRVLQREAGYATYDPQLDRVLDLDADRDGVLAAYARGMAAAEAISAAPLIAARQRPWWKFWG